MSLLCEWPEDGQIRGSIMLSEGCVAHTVTKLQQWWHNLCLQSGRTMQLNQLPLLRRFPYISHLTSLHPSYIYVSIILLFVLQHIEPRSAFQSFQLSVGLLNYDLQSTGTENHRLSCQRILPHRYVHIATILQWVQTVFTDNLGSQYDVCSQHHVSSAVV